IRSAATGSAGSATTTGWPTTSTSCRRCATKSEGEPTSEGQMKITGVECHLIWGDTVRLNWILTLVRTDAGITGVSQVIMRRHELTVRESILELNRYLVGKDPLLREEHFEKMYRDGFWLGGALFNTAFSAVDMAMWDIAGKSAGLPIHSLLGGRCRDRVRVY